MIIRAAWAVVSVLFLTGLAIGQDERFDFGLSGPAVFSQSTRGNGITYAPTQSGGFLATIGAKVSAHGAVAFNYGRTKNSQIYNTPTLPVRVKGTVTEFSAAYIFRFRPEAKISPFVLGGLGALVFAPNDTLIDNTPTPIGAVRRSSLAGLYGGGVDYHVYSMISLRLQYRGLVYKTPDYNVNFLFTDTRGHMAEPSVGVVVRF